MQIRFGEFDLDSRRYWLRRRGEKIALRPKVFDLLIYLTRYRDRVVPREELVRALWGETRVGEGSLSGLVNELRAALGERGRGPSSIRTVHARGYQFVAAVETDGKGDGTALGARVEDLAAPGIAAQGERGGASPALDRIGLELRRISREGPRGLVLLFDPVPGLADLRQSMLALAAHLGMEGVLVRCGQDQGDDLETLADRLLERLRESHGLDGLCRVAPLEMHRLLEPRARRSDADESRAREDALRRLIRRLAAERPLLLIVEAIDELDRAALALVESLIGIGMESVPLLLVATASSEILEPGRLSAESRQAAAGDPDGAADSGGPRGVRRLIEESGLETFRLIHEDLLHDIEPAMHDEMSDGMHDDMHDDPQDDRRSLDAWCRDRGIAPLPASLADALLAHFEGRIRHLEAMLEGRRDGRSSSPQGDPDLEESMRRHRMLRVTGTQGRDLPRRSSRDGVG